MHSRHARNGGNCDGLSTEGLCSQAGPQARPVRGQAGSSSIVSALSWFVWTNMESSVKILQDFFFNQIKT